MKNEVRMGIIGTGFARSTQLPAFKNCAGARLVAIASGHRENAEAVAREFGIEHVEDDWRGVVTRDDVDLVSIVTPVVTHCEIALAALAQGKALLCEKPMAMDAAEARRMADRAKEKGAFALIDHELRFLPGRIKAREILHRGDLGKIKHAQLTFRSDSRADVDRPWNWWSDIKKGGGALGAIGSHVIDGFHWLLESEVAEVSCSLATHVRQRKDEEGVVREVTTDDEANLLVRFADSDLTEGATGNVSMSMVEAGKPEHRLEIFGARGALMIEENGDLWQTEVGEGKWHQVEVDQIDIAPGLRESGWARGFTVFSQKIVDALRADRTTVEGAATFEDGYRTQVVLDAARRGHDGKCWIAVK
jgi:predicted dehydrogenase